MTMKRKRSNGNSSAAQTAQRLRASRADRKRMLLTVMEAAQREATQLGLLNRLRKENAEIRRQLDVQRVHLDGFRLEVGLRHYELPFAAAQLNALLTHEHLTPTVEHALRALLASIQQLVEWTAEHKPTLDPATWVALARTLGIVSSARTPVVRVKDAT